MKSDQNLIISQSELSRLIETAVALTTERLGAFLIEAAKIHATKERAQDQIVKLEEMKKEVVKQVVAKPNGLH